jgi:hypothetical protein
MASALENSSMHWQETTSLLIVESTDSLKVIATRLKKAIAPSVDLFLIRMLDNPHAYIGGTYEDSDVFTLLPYLEEI